MVLCQILEVDEPSYNLGFYPYNLKNVEFISGWNMLESSPSYVHLFIYFDCFFSIFKERFLNVDILFWSRSFWISVGLRYNQWEYILFTVIISLVYGMSFGVQTIICYFVSTSS